MSYRNDKLLYVANTTPMQMKTFSKKVYFLLFETIATKNSKHN